LKKKAATSLPSEKSGQWKSAAMHLNAILQDDPDKAEEPTHLI